MSNPIMQNNMCWNSRWDAQLLHRENVSNLSKTKKQSSSKKAHKNKKTQFLTKAEKSTHILLTKKKKLQIGQAALLLGGHRSGGSNPFLHQERKQRVTNTNYPLIILTSGLFQDTLSVFQNYQNVSCSQLVVSKWTGDLII